MIDESDKPPNQMTNINLKSTRIAETNFKSLLRVGPEVLQKVESKLQILKDIYLIYSKYGDKLNDNNMNFAGFHNFLRDIDILYVKKESSDEFLSSRIFKSPSKSLITVRTNISSPKKLVNSVIIKGKIIDSEVFCIFCSITGFKNFDSSSKYKNHFDKNKGFSPKLGESGRTTRITKSSSLSSTKDNVPMKMDFKLFIKSLELISAKLYPDKSIDDAMVNFLESV